jgi:hypothetical protein
VLSKPCCEKGSKAAARVIAIDDHTLVRCDMREEKTKQCSPPEIRDIQSARNVAA